MGKDEQNDVVIILYIYLEHNKAMCTLSRTYKQTIQSQAQLLNVNGHMFH